MNACYFQNVVVTKLSLLYDYKPLYCSSLKEKVVGEEAFVRIAPAISGLADRATVHNLFKALVGDKKGLSLSMWLTYVDELLRCVPLSLKLNFLYF